MERYIISYSLSNYFCDSFDDNAAFACNIFWLIFCAGFISILYIVYKKVRRKFPVKVNCWFCNVNTSVSHELSSGWNCPRCEQYNGFNKDGDYNKIIPEQFNHKMNEDVFKTVRSSIDGKESNFQNNGFCKLCNINQQLKVQQLALFVPLNENNYYEEVEKYREKLEKAYKLCSKCEKTLQETIEKQEYHLMQSRLNGHKTKSFSNETKKLKRFKREHILVSLKKNSFLFISIMKIVIGVLIPVTLFVNFEREHHYLNISLFDEYVNLETLFPIFKILLDIQEYIFIYIKEVAAVGFFCSFLTLLDKNYKKANHINLLVWGLLYLSLWCQIFELHILISGVCLFFSIQEKQKKFIFLQKKSLTTKSGFQPLKEVLPEAFTNIREENKLNETIGLSFKQEISSPDEDIEIFENSKFFAEKIKRIKPKKNEVPSFCCDDKENVESVNLKSSFKNNSLLETNGNLSETNGPFSEVNNILNNLKLGENHKKSKKSPNFLFANHNFSEMKNSSLIKPAKFIKNLNSTSCSESNECNSRSSTPSSSYSGQKPVKIDSNRYNFSKTMSPISISPFNRNCPNNFFDYDGSSGFYNNANCFNVGFIPFPQFPNAAGHTTLFACTRPPPNVSFPLSSWPGYSSQPFSPTYNKFSDSSDLDNIFQESSKKFEQHRKWFKLKGFFYTISIFLNVITIMCLIYFTSEGVILFDWGLPTLDFFL